MPSAPVLMIIPHCSGYVPHDIMADMLGEDVYDVSQCQARLEYLFNEGDPYTDSLFYMPGASHVSGLVSRFVVDLNRKRDEGGMNGVIKLTDFSGAHLYPLDFQFSETGVAERLERYYDPFHSALDRNLARDDILFFIDGHSMTPLGPMIGPDRGEPRPAFCLITGGDPEGHPLTPGDSVSIPAGLAQEVVRLLKKHFDDIVKATPGVPDAYWINDPFSKGGTNDRLSNPVNPNAKPGFALEFNRALYLQEGNRDLNEELDAPIPGRIKELNKRFQAFVNDLIPLFEALRVGETGAIS